ncbi:MAG: PIN domain-containing protein [Verrucomicrobiales bacterium]|nr:PIN domain-containing protein [Verrucomicrobiales bacterium]
MVLVDSSIWIEAARRNGDIAVKVALEGLLEEYEATLCPPVRLEVLGGARAPERRLLSHAFSVLPWVEVTPDTWRRAVDHCWRLHDGGLSVPWNDLLIASVAVERGCRIYARDHHFDLMKPVLGLALYEPGYGGAFAPEAAEP